MKKIILILSVLVVGLFSTASGYYITASNNSCGVLTYPEDNTWGSEGVRWVKFAWQCGTNPPCVGFCHVQTTYMLYKNYMHRGQQLLVDETCDHSYLDSCCSQTENFAESRSPMSDFSIKQAYGPGNYTLMFNFYQGECGNTLSWLGQFPISFVL